MSFGKYAGDSGNKFNISSITLGVLNFSNAEIGINVALGTFCVQKSNNPTTSSCLIKSILFISKIIGILELTNTLAQEMEELDLKIIRDRKEFKQYLISLIYAEEYNKLKSSVTNIFETLDAKSRYEDTPESAN